VSRPRYLTKSRFKLALECPTKLFYTAKKEYADSKLEDSFLAALAEGGIQVGELAKQYYPGGVDIKPLDYDAALAATHEALAQENVVIFEAAIKFENLFIRVDVLEKKGDRVSLFEVKSKSYMPGDDAFVGARGAISSVWRPYLEDIAFQKHVVTQAFPEWSVNAHLTLIDKSTACPSDGLNQKFRVHTGDDGRKAVVVTELTDEERNQRILIDINVDALCEDIYAAGATTEDASYGAMVSHLAAAYADDTKITPVVSAACDKCEFFARGADLAEGLRCGKSECWGEALMWTPEQVRQPTVLDIANYRGKQKMIGEGVIRMSDVAEDDIKPKDGPKSGLSNSQRQWMQIEKCRNGDNTPWMDHDGLASEMAKWKFPLHFIDFETAMAAIPFKKDRRPYEAIAFQFSHHVTQADGAVDHVGEFINAVPGHFPNYDFARALRDDLEGDDGTILRYAAHENTYLNHIHKQLLADQHPPPDRDQLIDFIRTITKAGSDNTDQWEGDRNMVDLCDIVKRFYFDPLTGGSSSIKLVLPAILSRSNFLKGKYSKPNYGTPDGLSSKNFKEMQWVVFEGETVKDPYELLPPIFDDVDDKELLMLSREDEQLHDGGAAMTAYARLQFEEMGDVEREEITEALLKYCELDTLAMVMVYEGLKNAAHDG
jgi:hypothetical protein